MLGIPSNMTFAWGGGVDDALLRSVDVEQDGTRQKQFDTLLRSTLQRFDEN